MASVPPKSTPRDAQVMSAILKDSGIVEYEPRLINQMLEFTYRYVTDNLEDAKVYSQHANKKTLDVDDIKLAVQCRTDHCFTNPMPKDLLQDIARHKNSQPLPTIKPYGGPRSIPDRYCLTNPNYKLKSAKKHIPQSRIQFGLPTQQRIGIPTTAKGIAVKSIGSAGGQSLTVVPKAGASGSGSSGQVTFINKPIVTNTKPMIRINTGGTPAGIGASGLAQMVTQTATTVPSATPTLPTTTASSSSSSSVVVPVHTAVAFNPLKRKIDDDYDG